MVLFPFALLIIEWKVLGVSRLYSLQEIGYREICLTERS